ncbi:type VI secretion system contractile sheath large subunit [Acanthopleuribacter pedis]|uniref:Type VI secretion system contractile sheath large subunit n=1 Tax=Acanthopleuribacter pedis TaxID=442870 RepID=A0A8J7Q5Y5_9BACT|nr:type VI secretion system contractile sheath large subunit [Acanthopleuribacter pedis]
MDQQQGSEEQVGAAVAERGLLDQIIEEGHMARNEVQQKRAKELIESFVQEVADNSKINVSHDTIAMLNERIAQIDSLISDQLNEVLHDEKFQQLESTWRGLDFLVSKSNTGADLKIKVLNASRDELQNDLEKASEFDQSTLFKKVYSQEFGTYGGHPFSMLLGDYQFGRGPRDVALARMISQVAASAHAPFISSAAPQMFDMDSFTDLDNPRDMAKLMESTELAKWRSFRETDDSRFFVLALPHILMRLPYGPDTVPVEDFHFVENVTGKEHNKYLWGNAAWALGQRMTESFTKYKWCAAIRGVEGGGAVHDLPAHSFKTDEGDVELKCPTEVAITDRREKELADLGFIPLVHCKGTDYAAFFSAQTTNKPKVYSNDAATSNARISSMLPYIMASSRFAHYLKSMMRDKIGTFVNREQVESYLNNWISQYVLLDDTAGLEVKAKFPLREGRIDVSDDPARPGCFRAVAFLRPHFQLDELSVSLRLVAELPPPAGG